MVKLQLDDRRRPWLPPLLLLALSLLAFSPVIFGGGFFWDDFGLILNNPAVRSSTGLYTIWFTHALPDYFPLTSTLFWCEYHLFGPSAPAAYHVVNVLLHAGAAMLLWRVLREWRIPGALIAALLFAVHPVNAESVAWIAEGKNTLCVGLMLAALLLWMRSERGRGPGIYIGALVLFTLSLLAKTASVMLPVAMLALLWYRRRLTVGAFVRTLPFFLLSLVLGLVTWWFQANNSIGDTPIRDDHFLSRLATAGYAVWWYLFKAIVPVNITFAYPPWKAGDYGAAAWIPLGALIVLAMALFLLRGVIGRGWLAALVAYVALLLPILGFINVFFMRYSLVSNHWQYPAIPALCAVAGAFAMWLARGAGALRWNGIVAAALAITALLAIDTAAIAAVYRTPAGVWEDVLAHDPNSWLAHARLGDIAMERARQGQPEALFEALVHLRKVVDERPDLIVGYTNLANAYSALGRLTEARALYEQALAAPTGGVIDRALLHVNYGALLGKLGDARGADAQFEEAVRINPKSRTAWYYLGIARTQRGDFAGAREAFGKSAAADPTFIDPQLQLAAIALRTGDRTAARRAIDAALAIDPANVDARRMQAALAQAPASLPASAPIAP